MGIVQVFLCYYEFIVSINATTMSIPSQGIFSEIYTIVDVWNCSPGIHVEIDGIVVSPRSIQLEQIYDHRCSKVTTRPFLMCENKIKTEADYAASFLLFKKKNDVCKWFGNHLTASARGSLFGFDAVLLLSKSLTRDTLNRSNLVNFFSTGNIKPQ